jgi:hypothetical protein
MLHQTASYRTYVILMILGSKAGTDDDMTAAVTVRPTNCRAR